MIRAFGSGLRMHLRHLTRSPFDLIGMLVWPIVFSSVAALVIGREGDPRALLAAALGAAVMMMWAQVVVGSGYALDQQRIQGTLELLVAAPLPFGVLFAPVMIANAAFGLYGLVVTTFWGRLVFGVPLEIERPIAFVCAAAAAVISIGMLGLVTAATLVVYRAAFFLGVSLQYPVFIACGLIVPFAVLPGWLGPVSWVLGPTWGFEGLREAALGGEPWGAIAMCLVLAVAYLALGVVCLRLFERLARDRATLKLS